MANCLYNGLELPALPEWDKETYPYAVIGFREYTDADSDALLTEYTFVVCTKRVVYNGFNLISCDDTSLGRAYWHCLVESSEWEFVYENAEAESTFFKINDVLWVGFDLLDQGGNLYLAASDPIPVNPAPTLDPTALLMCWQVGNRIASMKK